MIVYHWTSAAAAIIRDGFRDYERPHASHPGRGVWLSDVPVDQIIGNPDELDLLALDIPADVLLPFERITPGEIRTWREYLVPAEIVNRYGRPEVIGRRAL
jgi:hypothetical protein